MDTEQRESRREDLRHDDRRPGPETPRTAADGFTDGEPAGRYGGAASDGDPAAIPADDDPAFKQPPVDAGEPERGER